MRKAHNTMTAAEFRGLLLGDKPMSSGNPSHGNRKVRNAAKNEQNGVVFDSRIERYMHNLLETHQISFEFQKKYTILESFKYNGKAIRAITYTVDFFLPDHDIAIDTKGIITQQGQLRIKLLKRLFADLDRSTTIELPRTPSECDALVVRLITNQKQTSPDLNL